MTKTDRYIYIIQRYVFKTENIDTKLRFQNYFQFHAPSQQETAKVVADSNISRAEKPEKEIEPATEIFCHIYDRALSPTFYFLSCSKQSVLKIDKYENLERESQETVGLLVFKSNFNQQSQKRENLRIIKRQRLIMIQPLSKLKGLQFLLKGHR